MTGLMVIFLLIALSYMMLVEAEQARIKHVAVAHTEIKDPLYDELHKEFFFPRYVRILSSMRVLKISRARAVWNSRSAPMPRRASPGSWKS